MKFIGKTRGVIPLVELFAKSETSATFRSRTEKLTKEIASFGDDKILGADFGEWVHYYFEKYKIQPIILYIDNVSQSLSETKVEKSNFFYRKHDPLEPKTFSVDGYKITFTIPFDGDSDLLYLRPSTHYLSTFRVDSICPSSDISCGNIILSLEYTKEELRGKERPEFISQAFTSKFKNYIETIDRINNEVEHFNMTLQNTIMSALESRKNKANEYVEMGELLSIPLKINPNVSMAKPIQLKKAQTKKPEMPSIRPSDEDYAIPREDYDYIRRIIYKAGTSMEKTAKTFEKLDEEELRDVILSLLNSHYDGIATGETFNKSGKTDILIPFKNKAAFIAECKVWRGEEQLKGALKQLFSYTTWREIRTTLIILNKTNKDFSKILNVIQSHLEQCEICISKMKANANEWQCKFKKSSDNNVTIDVQIVVFDLYVRDKKPLV